MSRITARLAAGATLALALSAAPALAADPAPDPVGISRTPWGDVLPDTAPGLRMGLWQVTLPGYTAAPPHAHLGYQIIYVSQGTEGYHIISGAAEVHRVDGTVEAVATGDTFELMTGDWIVETPGMEHEAWNAGAETVLNVAATLFPDGAPLSVAVNVPSVAPSFAP